MGVVKQLAKGRSESPWDREGSGAVYWRFWFLFLACVLRLSPRPQHRDPGWAGSRLWAGVPWAGAQAHTARLTDGGSIYSLDDLFQWLIILSQTQDYFFNDIPVNNVQKLKDGLFLHRAISWSLPTLWMPWWLPKISCDFTASLCPCKTSFELESLLHKVLCAINLVTADVKNLALKTVAFQ